MKTTREFEHLPFNAFWEKGYKDGNVSTMGGPNHDIVELADALPPGTRVLDLGCGEGRNAFFLAGRGCQVTAVDRSAAGIEKLSALARRTGVPLKAVVADIAHLELHDTWDVIMAHGVIDYLDNKTWRGLLERLKEHTVPGGFNAYTCMLFTDEYPAGPEFLAAGFKHSLGQGELAAFYGDWEQVRHDRYVKWDQHPGIPLHCHPVDKLVVRKPGGSGPGPRLTPVPVGKVDLPRPVFDSLAMGLTAEEVLAWCGEPAVVDTFTLEGVQFGVGPTDSLTVDGYRLSLWYYGRAVLYVINGRVWGRALHDSRPVRMAFG